MNTGEKNPRTSGRGVVKRNEIIQMARQAGMAGLLTDIVTTADELERFAKLVEAACMPIERRPLTDEQATLIWTQAQDDWNALADGYNQWDFLGRDEMSILITRQVEAAHGITAQQRGAA